MNKFALNWFIGIIYLTDRKELIGNKILTLNILSGGIGIKPAMQ
jgi:hypothetical protein